MPITVGDVWKPYAKPSEKGRLIIRKKTVNRKSARVLARNQELARLAGQPNHPATIARNRCLNEEPWRSVCVYTDYVYVNGTKQEIKRCKVQCFRRLLKLAFQEAGLVKYGGATGGVVTA